MVNDSMILTFPQKGTKAKRFCTPLLLVIYSILFIGCSGSEVTTKYCNLPARLTIENVIQSSTLFTACESMGEYCTITSNGRQFLFTDATGKSDPINILAESDHNGYYLGLDGFIVGRLTIPEMGTDVNSIVCYDRACSNCYQNYNITKPLKLATSGYASCSSCGRTYNLNDTGNISDGPAGRPLYRYRVSYIGHTLVIHNGY